MTYLERQDRETKEFTGFREETPKRGRPIIVDRVMSAREKEVLNFLCKGMTDKEIALKMGIADMTVKVHVRNIFRCLRVNNRTRAVIKTLTAIPCPTCGGL